MLAGKREEERLSASELEELLSVGYQIEAIGVTRVDALAKLSIIQQVPLLTLMDSLSIQGPGIR